MNDQPLDYGKLAYETYCKARDWKSVKGEPLPQFEQQSEQLKAAWNQAGQAVRDAAVLGRRREIRLLTLTFPGARIVELAERLVSAGEKAVNVSASECHEITDFIIGLDEMRKAHGIGPQHEFFEDGLEADLADSEITTLPAAYVQGFQDAVTEMSGGKLPS